MDRPSPCAGRAPVHAEAGRRTFVCPLRACRPSGTLGMSKRILPPKRPPAPSLTYAQWRERARAKLAATRAEMARWHEINDALVDDIGMASCSTLAGLAVKARAAMRTGSELWYDHDKDEVVATIDDLDW